MVPRAELRGPMGLPAAGHRRRYRAIVTWVRRRWLALFFAAAAAAACTGDGAPSGTAASGAPAQPASTIQWIDCRLPAGPGALVRAIAPGGDGAPWTAVGQEGGGSTEVRPAAWTSPDGCAWRRVAVVAITPDGERTGFSAVARRGRLVVAQGRSYSRVHGNIRPTLWRAEGGAPLHEVELLRELFGGESGITVDALVPLPDAFLATGAYIGRDKFVAVHVWRTTDGTNWVRLPPGKAQSSTAAEQLLPRDMAAETAGTLVVGTAFRVGGGDGFDGAAWYAPAAAREWQRGDLSRTGLVGDGDQRLLTDAAIGAGYVAVGAVQSGAGFELRSAVSTDGVAWSAGGALPGLLLPGGGRPTADVAEAPGGGAIAGTAVDGRAELWVSADGRDWRPETVPGPADQASNVVFGPATDRLVLVVQTAAGPRLHVGRPAH
jgi:hypothetical protein